MLRRVARTARAAGNEHQVARFEVPVHHRLFMNVLKTQQRLVDDPHRVGRRQLAPSLQRLLQRFAFKILHHQVMEPPGFADLKRAHHIRVFQPYRQPRFALKAR